MIPIFYIIEFVKELEGGANRPFIVRVVDNTNQYIGQYVVKVFEKERAIRDNYLGKEFFCASLASQLDIKTPQLALLKIRNDVIDIPESIASKIEDYPFEVFLGIKYVEASNQFTPAFISNEINEYNIESIFAFDGLIINPDRTVKKPNLLLKVDDVLVIDHEYALGPLKEYEEGSFISKSFLVSDNAERRHIFYSFLKRKHRSISFDTFIYHLSNLNINFFDRTNRELSRYGYELLYLEKLKEYLNFTKLNSTIFVKSLKDLLD